MVVDWLLDDPKEATFAFACSDCQGRVVLGETFYLAKKAARSIKLCEQCAEEAHVADEAADANDRERWLGEL